MNGRKKPTAMGSILFVLVTITVLFSGCRSVRVAQPFGPAMSLLTTSISTTTIESTGEQGPEISSNIPSHSGGKESLDIVSLQEFPYIAKREYSGGIRNEFFATSDTCTICHQDMVDQAGNDVSTDSLWRAAMMANAGVDPYWQASVKSQLIHVPEMHDIIEDKCATCHMPMARYTLAQQDQKGNIFDDGLSDPDHPQHTFAMEGVSCTLCHQVEDHGLGEESSFSGEFVIDPDRPAGSRWAFGPYPETDRYEVIMGMPAGFVPREQEHMDQSELCATCHTLYTPYVNQEGEIAGTFPEQVPYLEWKHSDYVGTQACQDCHMPPAQGGVILSKTGGEPRSPFYRHLFVGGNSYMLRILRDFGGEIGIRATPSEMDRKIKDTHQQLQNNSARITISGVSWDGEILQVNVQIENLAGHKFPTAFPSRRAWIHLTVQDQEGNVIFESGDYNDDGLIFAGNHDRDPSSFEDHNKVIEREDEVQIYETVLMDIHGEITTTLLRAAGYIKDNRILPAGFDKGTAEEDIQVIGSALTDEDFQGGGDGVIYRIAVAEAGGPLTIDAEVLYQSIGYRWAVSLEGDQSSEAEAFLHYYRNTPNWPVLIAQDRTTVPSGD